MEKDFFMVLFPYGRHNIIMIIPYSSGALTSKGLF